MSLHESEAKNLSCPVPALSEVTQKENMMAISNTVPQEKIFEDNHRLTNIVEGNNVRREYEERVIVQMPFAHYFPGCVGNFIPLARAPSNLPQPFSFLNAYSQYPNTSQYQHWNFPL